MKKFNSESVSATAIAKSATKATNVAFSYYDTFTAASELGIPPHKNKWGTNCYTAYQANRIREALVKRAEHDSKPKVDYLIEVIPDKELVEELRARGWDVVCERKTIETL